MQQEDPMERLRARLDEVHEWPSVYMYKMILEPDEDRLNTVIAVFHPESEVLRKYSTSGRYVSVTVREVAMSASDVLARYEEVGRIGGVMML